MLGRALTLLETVAVPADRIGGREAARQTGIDRSAISRILAQFGQLRLCRAGRHSRRLRRRPGLFVLVAALSERGNPWKATEPFLRDLVRFNEPCYFAA
jgi:DNA-binding IclR family transcriptional regulator